MKPIFANLRILRPLSLFKSSKFNEEKCDIIFANWYSRKSTNRHNDDYTQFCRIKGCGGAGCPPPPPPPQPIIFERLKSPQQIIYRPKGNLSESPNRLKYRENILISRFCEHFSRNSRNLGHFWKFEKISDS